jgi:methylmalonyl-CoA mutase
MTELSLAADFPAATEADWLAIAEKALAGATFETLRTPLYEGFATEPLYAGVSRTPALPLKRGWQIVQPLLGETIVEVDERYKHPISSPREAPLQTRRWSWPPRRADCV